MPSAEFLLYLVIVVFAMFLTMNYCKDTARTEPEIQYKFIPVYKSPNDKSDDKQSNKSQHENDRLYQREQNDINIDIHNRNDRGFIDPLRKFDYDAVEDNFTPPFRRSYYDEHNYRNPVSFPTYTRGPPGRFRKVGTLIAGSDICTNDKYKFLLLMD